MDRLIGGIEIGGSKTVVLIARGCTIVEQGRIATTTPSATLAAYGAALREWQHHGPLAGLGIGSFSPLDLRTGRIALPQAGLVGYRRHGPIRRDGGADRLVTRASLDRIIQPPGLGALSGPLGTIALAKTKIGTRADRRAGADPFAAR